MLETEVINMPLMNFHRQLLGKETTRGSGTLNKFTNLLLL